MSPEHETMDSDAPPAAASKRKRPETRKADPALDEAALTGRSFTIDRPRAELYAFWRDFGNLARFMENIERVEVLDGRRSHWVVAAPGGRKVEWDALVVEERPGELIAWESAEGADIRHSGRIEFADAPPGRGTRVTATIAYDPPGGELGRILAKLFQKEPKIQARRDLRRFKQLMETGEISTSEPPAAAPRA